MSCAICIPVTLVEKKLGIEEVKDVSAPSYVSRRSSRTHASFAPMKST